MKNADVFPKMKNRIAGMSMIFAWEALNPCFPKKDVKRI